MSKIAIFNNGSGRPEDDIPHGVYHGGDVRRKTCIAHLICWGSKVSVRTAEAEAISVP
jgi:hypothetical protein